MVKERCSWTSLDVAVVDVEGNGRQPPDLVEIAIVPIDGGRIGDAQSWLVRPPRPITPIARRFHRISDDQVADAPTTAQIAGALRSALDGRVFVAHNAGVDLAVVTRELPGFQPLHVLDTLKLARRLLPGRMSYKLGSLAEDLALTDGLPQNLQPHRATYDAIVCARLLIHLASPTGQADLTLSALLGPDDATTPPPTLF